MPAFHVGEMFAGVGGFRLGLEGVPSKSWETNFLEFEETGFKVVWSNQWEPGNSKQWASKIYIERFGEEGHDQGDIHNFTKTLKDIYKIPQLDLLVGGFPCQDYSVARTKSGELGVKGEKGKLWTPIWQIISRIHKNKTSYRPKMILLENVPRLLNSPANARGLNFSVILKRLLGMSYEVEWRIINADDYGFPQQRSRVFILAYRTSRGNDKRREKINGVGHYGLNGGKGKEADMMEWWMFGNPNIRHRNDWEVGPFAEAFPAKFEPIAVKRELPKPDFWNDKKSSFGTAGYAWKGKHGKRSWVNQFCSWKTIPTKQNIRNIRDIMVNKEDEEYNEKYEIDDSELKNWEYEKGQKKEFRIRKIDLGKYPNITKIYAQCKNSKDQSLWDLNRRKFEKILGENGSYMYNEGAIAFPDSIDKPSRTIVTSEIGKSASRMRHLIKHDDGTHRTLFPIETERLNMFPDNWTRIDDISDAQRGFLMGNALVVGIVKKLSKPMFKLLQKRSN